MPSQPRGDRVCSDPAHTFALGEYPPLISSPRRDGLSDIFDADQRMQIEHHNPLRQLPRPAAAING